MVVTDVVSGIACLGGAGQRILRVLALYGQGIAASYNGNPFSGGSGVSWLVGALSLYPNDHPTSSGRFRCARVGSAPSEAKPLGHAPALGAEISNWLLAHLPCSPPDGQGRRSARLKVVDRSAVCLRPSRLLGIWSGPAFASSGERSLPPAAKPAGRGRACTPAHSSQPNGPPSGQPRGAGAKAEVAPDSGRLTAKPSILLVAGWPVLAHWASGWSRQAWKVQGARFEQALADGRGSALGEWQGHLPLQRVNDPARAQVFVRAAAPR